MDTEIDPESLALIIEIQLQDLQRINKGKSTIDHGPDSEVAAQIMEAEVKNLSSFYADRSMNRSITHALVTDADAIAAHIRQEKQAADDRAFALRENPQGEGRHPTATASSSASHSKSAEVKINQKLAALTVDEKKIPSAAELSNTTADPSASKGKSALRSCVACTSEVASTDSIRCPCSHDYCGDCTTSLFSAAINDESLFPPRCCQEPIPLDLIKPFLSATLLGAYEAKKLEHETPDKTYCHVRTCSAFVPPAFVKDDVATCVKCQSKTCTMCKGEMHTNDCPADTLTADFLQVATEKGWQRCYSCRRMVGLDTGCNHITCRCKAEFCYVCGLKWKQCSCAQWDEDRLIARVDNIVDREQGGRNGRDAARDAPTLSKERGKPLFGTMSVTTTCGDPKFVPLGSQAGAKSVGNIYQCIFLYVNTAKSLLADGVGSTVCSGGLGHGSFHVGILWQRCRAWV
ncbi:hypothetical protein E4U28_004300 [Claviceps purpurea]|nr:hypothetical protein E4U28_004300 [Claviceps purpurea]KAG6158074.1 hypothetical protein E4U37_006431 [Claviceps purpurea]